MILKEQLWLKEEFFIGQFGEQVSVGKGARTWSKAIIEVKNNPQAGFSAQENGIVNDLLETEVALGPADLVPEYQGSFEDF